MHYTKWTSAARIAMTALGLSSAYRLIEEVQRGLERIPGPSFRPLWLLTGWTKIFFAGGVPRISAGGKMIYPRGFKAFSNAQGTTVLLPSDLLGH